MRKSGVTIDKFSAAFGNIIRLCEVIYLPNFKHTDQLIIGRIIYKF